MTHYYYSAASSEYAYKLILLHNSMLKHDKDFIFFIICMNTECREILGKLGLQNTVLIDIETLEAYDRELSKVREKRSIKQYAWAAKPVAAIYILDNYKEVDHIIWLDGDMEFMSGPEAIYEEWGDYSVLLTEEKFTGKYEYISRIYGYFNTGFMGFKNDENSRKCLGYFRDKLLYEWNYGEKEQYRWNDQLYVSDWAERFENVGVIQNPGINLTPFIFNRLSDEWGKELIKKKDNLYIGEDRIVIYHFYGFIYLNDKEFDLCQYTDIYHKPQVQYIYLPYLKSAVEVIRKLRSIDENYCHDKSSQGIYTKNYFRLPE